MKLGAGENTFAILIGIERYGDLNWTLNAPAMDALRMAHYLLTHGVPGEQIHLYINEDSRISEVLAAERNALKTALTAAGARLIETPTRAVLDAALDPMQIPLLPETPDKTLIVYSSGHGVWQGGGTHARYLLTEDASAQPYDAINLTSVANQFVHYVGGNRFARQWWIQDACAKEIDTFQMRTVGVTNAITGIPCNHQVILSASKPGAVVTNDPERQSSAFTAALLELLASYESLDGLDLNHLVAALNCSSWAQSDASRLLHVDEFMQRCISVPVCPSMSLQALTALASILNGSAKITSELLRTVARRFLYSSSVVPASVMTLLGMLDSVVGEANSDLTTVEQFVLRLLTVLEQIRQQSNDTSWDPDIQAVERWIYDWPRSHASPAVNQRLMELRNDNQVMALSDVIVIDLSGGLDVEETRVWFYSGDQVEGNAYRTPEPTLTERLRSVLMQINAGFGLFGNTMFEVVLPVALIFEPYAGLEFHTSDEHSYFLGKPPTFLALRVLERWHDRSWQRPWQQSWKSAGITQDRVPRMVWLQSDNSVTEQGWSWHGTTSLETNRHALERSLRQGVACAAWCGPEHLERVTHIVQGEPYARLRNTQVGLAELKTPECNGVTCIVDTPDRIPPGAGGASSSLLQPSLRTST